MKETQPGRIMLLWFCLFLLPHCMVAVSQKTGDQSNKGTVAGYVIELCNEQKDCAACMFAHPECTWCNREDYTDKRGGRGYRCDTRRNLLRSGCDGTESYANALRDEKAESVRDEKDGSEAVLISPQFLELGLRPNEPYKLTLSVREAENYPVDLYYLMDLSYSMADDKEAIATLGNSLAQRMSVITTNVRLGFGSFVDKKVMPYVNIMPEKLLAPCSGCAAPYGFHNALPLTRNTSQFGEEVRKAPISGNLDGPEGGFDALMQAIVCKDKIGWRDHARHLLIFSTDELSHMAGDGLLGGVVLPNDGRCHLDENGVYTESTKQDYPSLSHIQHKLAEEKISLIFAVTKNRLNTYKKISAFFEGSVVGELASDSTNIVNLVESNYNKIASKLHLHAEGPDGLEVKFASKCFGSKLRETDECDGMTVGSKVEFEVTVTATKCPENSSAPLSLKIYRLGIGQSLVINATVKCDCDCQKKELREEKSPRCGGGNGTYVCGICQCAEGRYGKNCECGVSEEQTNNDYEASCRSGDSTYVCSGNGVCRCGECLCDVINVQTTPKKRYHGQYCQCNDYACSYSPDNKLICGGESRGTCYCGECSCKAGWTGSACQCTTDRTDCISANGLECNGKGKCECGQCVCDRDLKYGGRTCEDCPSCPPLCEDKKTCVQCDAYKSGPLSEQECKANCPDIRVVDVLEPTNSSRRCQFRDDDDCTFYFVYDYDRLGNVDVQVQRTKECHRNVEFWWIIIGVVVGIVLLGLLALLIWRLVTFNLDQKEYNAYLEGLKRNTKSNMELKALDGSSINFAVTVTSTPMKETNHAPKKIQCLECDFK